MALLLCQRTELSQAANPTNATQAPINVNIFFSPSFLIYVCLSADNRIFKYKCCENCCKACDHFCLPPFSLLFVVFLFAVFIISYHLLQTTYNISIFSIKLLRSFLYAVCMLVKTLFQPFCDDLTLTHASAYR